MLPTNVPPPKLVKLKCRPIKGDENKIYVDYGTHDKHSEKSNHNHTAIISRSELREMLWKMIPYVEDGSVVVALDQARRKSASKYMREVNRKLKAQKAQSLENQKG
jgi:hypothetical protein